MIGFCEKRCLRLRRQRRHKNQAAVYRLRATFWWMSYHRACRAGERAVTRAEELLAAINELMSAGRRIVARLGATP